LTTARPPRPAAPGPATARAGGDPRTRRRRPRPAVRRRGAVLRQARQELRQQQVCAHVERADEVEPLRHEADAAPAPAVARRRLPASRDRCRRRRRARCRRRQTGQDVEQRRLRCRRTASSQCSPPARATRRSAAPSRRRSRCSTPVRLNMPRFGNPRSGPVRRAREHRATARRAPSTALRTGFTGRGRPPARPARAASSAPANSRA